MIRSQEQTEGTLKTISDKIFAKYSMGDEGMRETGVPSECAVRVPTLSPSDGARRRGK